MNIIPREGGNTFSGSLFLAGTVTICKRQHGMTQGSWPGLDQLSQEQLGMRTGARWLILPIAFSFRALLVSQQLHRQLRRQTRTGRPELIRVRPDTSYRDRDTLAQRQRPADVKCQNKVGLFVDSQDPGAVASTRVPSRLAGLASSGSRGSGW
jgi:hypothetical protein